MAASIYATPPPDLIGEDTGLSNSSDSSNLPSNNISTNGLSVHPEKECPPFDTSSGTYHTQHCYTRPSPDLSVLSPSQTGSAYLSPEIFDASDAAKNKRRKQTTPLRLSAGKDSNGVELANTSDEALTNNNNNNNDKDSASLPHKEDVDQEQVKLIETNILLQQKMDGGLLDNLDIVQRAALLISQLQKDKAQDLSAESMPTDLSTSGAGQNHEDDVSDGGESQKGQTQMANLKLLMSEIMENKDCADCGAKFDSNLKLKMHIFQEHGHSVMRYPNMEDGGGQEEGGRSGESTEHSMLSKLQMMGSNQQPLHMGPGKPEDWMALTGLPFPFPHDGSSYLSQMPMLSGMSSQMGQFGVGGSTMDSLSRPGPPLRIFNPEAYCDLCNKEFCNKYFLKTHRANKHGIYEHSSNTSDSSASNSATAPPPPPTSNAPVMNLPLSANNNNNGQQLLTESSFSSNGNGNLMPAETSVHCDVCMKKFANTFAMKRHRSKAHETQSVDKSDQHPMSSLQTPLEGDQRSASIRFPEDFRPDFSVEQEDASFTPQPRKLSPVSSQQARDSNFSVDKLKRLGVLNPDAFCEICCKEYCNKYFLRTHKLKRHGILMPPDEVKEMATPSMERNPWQFLQGNPLNLMLGDFNPIQQLQQKFINDMTDLASRKQSGLSKSPEPEEEHRDMEKDTNRQEFADEESAMNRDKNSAGNSRSVSPNADQQADVDAISMDLQKLQSMILQLNDLNANHAQIIPCHLCGKELENQYLFHAHLLAEHGHMAENALNLKQKSGSASPTSPQPSSFSQLQQQLANSSGASQQNEFCKQCDKDFANAAEFKQHLFEVHGLMERPGSVSPVREGFITPDRPTTTNNNTNVPATPTGEARRPYTMTPTSSYCEICNKELCNKYFMKTHMQRMHGIEIENGSQIGGVVCNICNKELCSKYFLRVHKHNTHGIIEDGAPLPPQIQAKVNGEAAAAAAAAAAASSGQATNVDQSEGKLDFSIICIPILISIVSLPFSFPRSLSIVHPTIPQCKVAQGASNE